MNLSIEEIKKALNYELNSPFCRKMGELSAEEEEFIANEIFEASSTLGSIKKEHENAISILTQTENDTSAYLKELENSKTSEESDLYREIEEKKKILEDTPNRDEKYVEECEKELKKAEDERAQAAENNKKIILAHKEALKRKYKKLAIMWGMFILNGLLLILFGSLLDSVSSKSPIYVILTIYAVASLILGITALFMFPYHLYLGLNKNTGKISKITKIENCPNL